MERIDNSNTIIKKIHGVNIIKQHFYNGKFIPYTEINADNIKHMQKFISESTLKRYESKCGYDVKYKNEGGEDGFIIKNTITNMNTYVKFGTQDEITINRDNTSKKELSKLFHFIRTDMKWSNSNTTIPLIAITTLQKYCSNTDKDKKIIKSISTNKANIKDCFNGSITCNNDNSTEIDINTFNSIETYVKLFFLNLCGIYDIRDVNIVKIPGQSVNNYQVIDLTSERKDEENESLLFDIMSDNKFESLCKKFIEYLKPNLCSKNDDEMTFLCCFLFCENDAKRLLNMYVEQNSTLDSILDENFFLENINKNIQLFYGVKDKIKEIFRNLLKQAFTIEPNINNAYYIYSLSKSLKNIHKIAKYFDTDDNKNFSDKLKEYFVGGDNKELYEKFKENAKLAKLICQINKNNSDIDEATDLLYEFTICGTQKNTLDVDLSNMSNMSNPYVLINEYIKDNNFNICESILFLKNLFASYLKVVRHKNASCVEGSSLLDWYNGIFPNESKSPIEFINTLDKQNKDDLKKQIDDIMEVRGHDYLKTVKRMTNYKEKEKEFKNITQNSTFLMLKERYDKGFTTQEKTFNKLVTNIDKNVKKILQSNFKNINDLSLSKQNKIECDIVVDQLSSYNELQSKLQQCMKSNSATKQKIMKYYNKINSIKSAVIRRIENNENEYLNSNLFKSDIQLIEKQFTEIQKLNQLYLVNLYTMKLIEGKIISTLNNEWSTNYKNFIKLNKITRIVICKFNNNTNIRLYKKIIDKLKVLEAQRQAYIKTKQQQFGQRVETLRKYNSCIKQYINKLDNLRKQLLVQEYHIRKNIPYRYHKQCRPENNIVNYECNSLEDYNNNIKNNRMIRPKSNINLVASVVSNVNNKNNINKNTIKRSKLYNNEYNLNNHQKQNYNNNIKNNQMIRSKSNINLVASVVSNVNNKNNINKNTIKRSKLYNNEYNLNNHQKQNYNNNIKNNQMIRSKCNNINTNRNSNIKNNIPSNIKYQNNELNRARNKLNGLHHCNNQHKYNVNYHIRDNNILINNFIMNNEKLKKNEYNNNNYCNRDYRNNNIINAKKRQNIPDKQEYLNNINHYRLYNVKQNNILLKQQYDNYLSINKEDNIDNIMFMDINSNL